MTQEPAHTTATRAAYDTVAAAYADLLADALDTNPFDRAVLALFAELVHAAAATASRASAATARPGPVLDLGCGPGRITAHLAALGLDARGIDLSPAMVEQARARHPGLDFRVGQITALDLPADSAAGLVAWYSLIHIPPAEHPGVLRGFRRILTPGGLLLVAFHVGDERRHITDAYGHTGLDYEAYRLPPDRVEQQAVAAGFEPVARLIREPISSPPNSERSPQAYVLLRARN